MPDEADLLTAADAASAHARPGEHVVAVIAADPFGRGLVYLCALRAGDGDGGELGWIALADGAPVDDVELVREAATLAALCETAEEAAMALEADELQSDARRALALAGAGDEPLRTALAAVAEAAGAVAATASGVRVARSGYLDELGEGARALADAAAGLRTSAEALSATLSGEPGDPHDPLARAAWAVLDRLIDGRPDRYSTTIGSAGGAVDALASDVLAGYRGALVGDAGGHDHQH